MIEMELVSETSDLINPWTRLSARETLIDFCRSEFFKTCNTLELLSFMDFFPSSDIKTKPKRLKLLRFERGVCFRLQVKNKNKGGGVKG